MEFRTFNNNGLTSSEQISNIIDAKQEDHFLINGDKIIAWSTYLQNEISSADMQKIDCTNLGMMETIDAMRGILPHFTHHISIEKDCRIYYPLEVHDLYERLNLPITEKEFIQTLYNKDDIKSFMKTLLNLIEK